MNKLITILFTCLGFSIVFAQIGERTIERQTNAHLKEILKSWNNEKGTYLYQSMDALAMKETQPLRTQSIQKTPFELFQSMDENRYYRVKRTVEESLKEERNTYPDAEVYYWQQWLNVINASQCEMRKASSNGDPHLRTLDKGSFDFQNAGDYVLAASENHAFEIQAQQYRKNESIALNGGVALNINNDVVSIEQNKGKLFLYINGEEQPQTNANYLLPQGGIVNATEDKINVKWPSGEELRVKSRKFEKKLMLDLTVFIPECQNGYYGLLGNNNGEEDEAVGEYRKAMKNREIAAQVEQITKSYDPFNEVDNKTKKLIFISRMYSEQFRLDSVHSLFQQQMVALPDSVRYPQIYTTVDDLNEEVRKTGREKALEVGVAEEDIEGAIYDYGFLGMEPVAYNETYISPKRKVAKEPQLTKDGNDLKKEQNKGSDSINFGRVIPTIIIGSSTRVSSPRKAPSPNRSTPSTPRRSGSVTLPPTR